VKLWANIFLFLACAASVAAVLLSIYPGMLRDLMFVLMLTSIIWLPLAAVLGIVWLVLMVRSKARLIDWPWVRYGLAAVVLGSAFVLVLYYVPRRLAFMASLAQFQALVAQAPVQEYGGTALNQRLGVFMVEDYAADQRGGVYFRVYQGGDGIGPDVMSYGFTYQPNRAGTPYGASSYSLYRLGSGWYWFHASDDWY
jgi:hypothetical protein